MALTPGDIFGDFRIVREIGRGGMGIVYEAVQLSLNRRVAVKILPQELATDPHAAKRFRREVEAVARLRQPNIVPVYSFAEQDGILYYAMELLEGRSVSELIKETRHATQGSDDAAKVKDGEDASASDFEELQLQQTVAMPSPPPVPW